LLPYAVDDVVKGRRRAPDASNVEMMVDEEGNLVEVGGVDDLNEASDGEDEESAVSSQSTAASKTSSRKNLNISVPKTLHSSVQQRLMVLLCGIVPLIFVLCCAAMFAHLK
uniref:Transmembrane protein n=1 Tax=Toxocara canis TaxID=6265 RepID=A0A183U8Z5_TOXCA